MAGGNLWRGVAYALLAGMIWGMVFVAPVLLPEYSPASLVFGRYLAFALVALVVAWSDRARLRQLRRADWLRALQLTLVGNFIYYLFLASAIQTSGVPLASVLIGTLPVVIAVTANWHQRSLPWRQLLPSLALMACGIALVNLAEWKLLSAGAAAGYLLGGALALVAVAAWTWYPIHNAAWLQAHPQHSPSTWTTAQGVATLPLAVLGWVGMGLWQGAQRRRLGLRTGPASRLLPGADAGHRPAGLVGRHLGLEPRQHPAAHGAVGPAHRVRDRGGPVLRLFAPWRGARRLGPAGHRAAGGGGDGGCARLPPAPNQIGATGFVLHRPLRNLLPTSTGQHEPATRTEFTRSGDLPCRSCSSAPCYMAARLGRRRTMLACLLLAILST